MLTAVFAMYGIMIVPFLSTVAAGLSIGLAALVLFDKLGGDDAGGYRNNGIAQDHDNGRDQLAQFRTGGDIAVTQELLEAEVTYWEEAMPRAEVLPISALEKVNTEYLLKRLLELIPVSPPYFEKDALTDKSERFFVSEIIREQILLNYNKEIPYSVEVEVEEFLEEDTIIRIRTTIYVARDSQKGIIIGHKGSKLKAVGVGARKQMEAFFNKKIHLETFVKVKKNWRDSDLQLKRFGYKQ